MADIKASYLACPIRQVVSRFGDKWSMLVLYMLHTSETGVLRFNEIRRLILLALAEEETDNGWHPLCSPMPNVCEYTTTTGGQSR